MLHIDVIGRVGAVIAFSSSLFTKFSKKKKLRFFFPPYADHVNSARSSHSADVDLVPILV